MATNVPETFTEVPNSKLDTLHSLSSYASELYESAKSLLLGTKNGTGDLVREGVLPDVQLGSGPESADESVGRGRDSKLPSSDAIREAVQSIADPQSSLEAKLKSADEMARLGQNSFLVPDGRRYDVSTKEIGGRILVSIHTMDDQGNSHAVLRGIIERKGEVSKQLDANGKAVPYETGWASENLKDSPLVGSKEKTEVRPASSERTELNKTLTEKRIAPHELTAEERRKLANEHGELARELKQKQNRYELLKKTTEFKNKPLVDEIDRTTEQLDKLSEKDTELALDVGRRNQQVADNLREAGIGDGKTFDVEDPETFKCLRRAVAEKNGLDPSRRIKLEHDINALEKANSVAKEHAKQSAKLDEKLQKLMDKKEESERLLRDLSKELKDLRSELRKNEAQLKEGKFHENLAAIDKLPKEKREAIYKAMEQIAKNEGGPPNYLSPEQRQNLVVQIAHQIAHPQSITQGNKGTCGLASTELELAKNNPDKYAKYLADLATNGETKLPNGRSLKISADMINRNGKAHDDANPERSLASKIFQTATANRVIENEATAKGESAGTYVTERPGSRFPIELPDIDPRRSGKDFRPIEDTGERIVFPDGSVKHWEGVDHEDIAKLTTDLTGEEYEAKKIINGRNLDDPLIMAQAEKDFIEAAKKNGLPMKVSMTMLRGDFTGMDSEGGHELVVSKLVEGSPAMVYFENTAGGTDHSYPTGRPIPLSTLLKSMRETRMSDGNTHIEGYAISKRK